MAKFNPYKINPFKVMTVIGTVLRYVFMAVCLAMVCYGSYMATKDSWGVWAFTAPVVFILAFAAIFAVAFFIGYGYELLRSKYEDAKLDYAREKARQDFEVQEGDHV